MSHHHHKSAHSSSTSSTSSTGTSSTSTSSSTVPVAQKPAALSAPLDPSKNVVNMLTADQLTKLRGGFSGDAFAQGPHVSLGSSYPPVTDWLDPFLNRFFLQNVLPADRREQVILSVLAGHSAPASYLGIHVYGALMEGLSPEDVANTLLLASNYLGLDKFNVAITTMGKTMQALAQCATTGVTETNAVVGAVAKALS